MNKINDVEQIKYSTSDPFCDHYLEKTFLINKVKIFSIDYDSSEIKEVQIPALKCLKCGGYGRSK